MFAGSSNQTEIKMGEADTEQKSEASTVEITQESLNGPQSDKSKSRKLRSTSTLSGRTTTCKVVLLEGTEYECQVDVS